MMQKLEAYLCQHSGFPKDDLLVNFVKQHVRTYIVEDSLDALQAAKFYSTEKKIQVEVSIWKELEKSIYWRSTLDLIRKARQDARRGAFSHMNEKFQLIRKYASVIGMTVDSCLEEITQAAQADQTAESLIDELRDYHPVEQQYNRKRPTDLDETKEMPLLS